MSSRLRRWWLLLALILATTMVARTGWLLDQAKVGTLSDGKLAFGLAARGEVVKLARLRDVLPEGTVRVTPEERAEQRRERAAAYKRRLPELDS